MPPPALPWRGIIQAAVIAILLALLYREPISVAAETWSADPDWSHGWIVPAFALYLLHARRDRLRHVAVRPAWSGLPLLIAALAAYAWFLAVWPYGYPRPLSLVLAAFAAVATLAGWSAARAVWLPVAFLALAIPIPDSIYVRLTLPLRLITTRAAAAVLSLFPGLDLQVQGVVIDYAFRGSAGSLNVEEACAGMRLMMAFVTLGVAAAWLGDRPLWNRLVMLAACVPIAVLCNVVRVTITGGLTVAGRADLAQGTAHELLGLAMLPLALGMFVGLGWAMRRAVVQVDEDELSAIGDQRSAGAGGRETMTATTGTSPEFPGSSIGGTTT